MRFSIGGIWIGSRIMIGLAVYEGTVDSVATSFGVIPRRLEYYHIHGTPFTSIEMHDNPCIRVLCLSCSEKQYNVP